MGDLVEVFAAPGDKESCTTPMSARIWNIDSESMDSIPPPPTALEMGRSVDGCITGTPPDEPLRTVAGRDS